MNLPVQHLSDEAVAAFADGALTAHAHNRAAAHTAQCPECASAVAEQQAAASALRAAPVPMLPAGLLDRLRAVPVTTPLSPRALALAPDGSAVFPAFGTSTAMSNDANDQANRATLPASRRDFHFPIPVPHVGRRTQHLALVALATAMITVGVAASASANTASPAPTSRFVPAGANPVQPVGFTAKGH